MSVASSRDLRNHTAEVLRRAADGETVTITVHGAPVAELRPVRAVLPPFFRRTDLVAQLALAQADSALRAELAELAGETTDDLET